MRWFALWGSFFCTTSSCKIQCPDARWDYDYQRSFIALRPPANIRYLGRYIAAAHSPRAPGDSNRSDNQPPNHNSWQGHDPGEELHLVIPCFVMRHNSTSNLPLGEAQLLGKHYS